MPQWNWERVNGRPRITGYADPDDMLYGLPVSRKERIKSAIAVIYQMGYQFGVSDTERIKNMQARWVKGKVKAVAARWAKVKKTKNRNA